MQENGKDLIRKMKKRKKICFICSGGGHFEQIKQLNEVRDRYDWFYVLTNTKITKELKDKKYLITFLGRTSKVSYFVNIIIWFVEELFVFVKERPDVIITTGAADTVPMCLIARVFGRKIIFIETFARRTEPSKTGKFLYKYADVFIVQWKELLKFYPKAIYGGWIY